MKVAKHIEDLVPYKPGKSIEETRRELGLETIHKLASNESPLPPSDNVIKAMTEAVQNVHLYPDPTGFELTQELSRAWDVPQDWIGLGNGSNELIDLAIRTFCQPGDNIITSEAVFIAYRICAQAAGVETVQVPMTADYRFDLDRVASSINERTRIVFIANPNNPTGTYVTQKEMEAFLDRTQEFENLIVVLDEAYNEFVRAEDCANGHSCLNKYSQVVLMRTLSKVYGLAGLRIGAMIARPEYLQYFHRVRNPFNVNVIAQKAAVAALNDREFLSSAQRMCWDGLDYFYEHLARLNLQFLPSQANFVLFDFGRDARGAFQDLLQEGVVLRPVVEYGLPNHLRMSVGTREANEAAIQAIEKVLT